MVRLQMGEKSKHSTCMRDFIIAFWLMGVLNNALFVIMLAGAKSISEGGTALVFIANTLPSLCLKLSAPHWFHLVGYKWRLCGASCLFMSSFCTVAWFAMHKTRTTAGYELIGVALGSVGGSIGEASLLALAGRLDTEHKGSLLTAFSSGTGLAGIFGFGWKAFWNDFLGISFSRTLLIANVLPMAYATIYLMLLDTARLPVLEDECLDDENVYVIDDADGSHAMRGFGTVRNRSDGVSVRVDSRNSAEGIALMSDPALLGDDMPLRDSNEERRHDQESPSLRPNKSLMELRAGQRFRLVLSLWPYMVPLFLVYFSEYAMMSGVWTAIGFPVDNVEARNKFYLYSSWMYQVGAFISRSSGTLFQASIPALWLMPCLQFGNLILFSITSVTYFWYDWSLLIMCLLAGLLGGGVYVNAFTRISSDVPNHLREFALSSASVADSFGVILADVLGLFMQSCIYDANKIQGAVVSCPVR